MCSKVVKLTMCGMGVVGTQQCSRPEYKDGLCAYHYKRKMEKSKPWIERKNYRSATQEDLETPRSLKLKQSQRHNIYRVQNNIVQVYLSKRNTWNNVDIPADFNLFCVKI